jgi:hypothetical protein
VDKTFAAIEHQYASRFVGRGGRAWRHRC